MPLRPRASAAGTPEYMAPELYLEVYDTKADVYSFGLCVLELDTHEFPYKECTSMAGIFMKVTAVSHFPDHAACSPRNSF